MAIVCPACEAKFRTPPAEVSPFGPFQCGRCEHEWSVKPPRISLDAPALAPEMADLQESETIRTNLPVKIAGEEPEAAPEPVYVDRLSAPHVPSNHGLFASLSLMALCTLVAGTLVFKDAVMAEAPATKPFYALAGLVSASPDLSIANVVTTKTDKDGIRQLIVRGEIQNVADNTVPVPPIKLTVRDKSNVNLYAWTVSTAKPSLKAGEKSRFTAVAHDYPNDAANVEVEFETPAQ